MEERLYTPQEAADILKVKKNTIYDMIKKGTLSATKVGKQFRITETDLNRVLRPTATVSPQVSTFNYGEKKEAVTGSEPIIVCGQDLVLDMLCTSANQILGNARFVRSYEGSYNGVHSMYQGEVTLASVHIWDRYSNTYNLPFVKTLLPGENVRLYHVLNRPIGFYVAKGNPKKIESIEDFKRDDIQIVNREKGSGIRILTDSLLGNAGITASAVSGYNRIVNSHLAAAAVISKGGADCAIGNKNVAMQFTNLDFIFLKNEQYDVVVRECDTEKPEVAALIQVLQSQTFRDEINAMGIYDTTGMGTRLL